VGSLRFNWSRLELVCLLDWVFGWVALELEQKKMKDETFAIILILFLFVIIVAAATTFHTTIQNSGNVKVTALECNVQNIDWGVLNPGQQADRNVSVRAIGTHLKPHNI
jgi:PhoPQ-activated pathogenicity-related protein